jgi:hypothetical protein
MKKTLAIFIILLLLPASVLASALIPQDGWVHKALVSFSERGLTTTAVTPDSVLSRQDAARVVQELLDLDPGLPLEDIALIEALKEEFAYELAYLGEDGEEKKRMLEKIVQDLKDYRFSGLSFDSLERPSSLKISGFSRFAYTGINIRGDKDNLALLPLIKSVGLKQEYRVNISGPIGKDVILTSYIQGGGLVSYGNKFGSDVREVGNISLEDFYLNILYNNFAAELGNFKSPVNTEFTVYDKNITGLVANVTLGDISSKFTVGRVAGDIAPYVYAVEGQWELDELKKVELGAVYIDYDDTQLEEGDKRNPITSIDGKVKLSEILTVSGEYANNRQDSALRVGADVTLGPVQVDADFHTVGARFDSALGKGSASDSKGYDLETKVGISDILSVFTRFGKVETGISTDHSESITSLAFGVTLSDLQTGELALGHEIKGIEKTSSHLTSIDLKYFLTEAAVVRAGYKIFDKGFSTPLDEKGKMTTLGIDYNLAATDDATVKAGYTIEKVYGFLSPDQARVKLTTSAVLEYSLAENAHLRADYSIIDKSLDSTTVSTSLGLNYYINKDTFMSVGYKMLDFTDYQGKQDDYKANLTSAELTIKF